MIPWTNPTHEDRLVLWKIMLRARTPERVSFLTGLIRGIPERDAQDYAVMFVRAFWRSNHRGELR